MQIFKEIRFKVRTTDGKLTLPVPMEWDGQEVQITISIDKQSDTDSSKPEDDFSGDEENRTS